MHLSPQRQARSLFSHWFHQTLPSLPRLVAKTCLFWAIAIPSATAQTVLVQEAFSGSTANPNWTSGIGNIIGGVGSDFPCLTAAPPNPNNPPIIPGGNPNFPVLQPIDGCPPTSPGSTTPIDPPGQGVLRITSDQNDQAGFVVYNTPVPSADGLVITFEIYQYSGSGADGISFFVMDGTLPPPSRAGSFGGSLGYAQRTGGPGLVGGYVGIGLDAFGNYSNPTEGRQGGTGFIPDAVAIRGSQAINYRYLFGTASLPQGIDSPTATTRAQVVTKKVRVILTPNNRMSVEIDFGSGYVLIIPTFDLSSIPGQGSLPSLIRFGFGGATGNSTNINEIRDFRVVTIPPDLSLTKTSQGNFTIGSNGTYVLTVQNSPAAGSTTGTITITDILPTGLQFLSGTGTNWVCSANGQIVTCSYTGGAAAPGAVLPPVNLAVVVTPAAPSTVANSATVATPGDSNSTNNNASVETKIGTAPTKPSLRLVKRITNITRGGIPLSGVDFSRFVDDPADANDSASGWSRLPPVGIFKLDSAFSLQSGDEIEYTVYYLSDGESPALSVVLCDPIPSNTVAIADSLQIKRGQDAPLPGGKFFSPLAPLPENNGCPNPTNPDGVLLFDLGDISNTPNRNTGFVRFRVRLY